VQIDSRPGGEWALFGGNVEGKFVELVPGKKIVQTWRFASWPAGIGCASRLLFCIIINTENGTRCTHHLGFFPGCWELTIPNPHLGPLIVQGKNRLRR
jgi:uncharacterized protein YndB with AHSA1/START domain